MLKGLIIRGFIFILSVIGFFLIAQNIFYGEVMSMDILTLEFTHKYLVMDFLTPLIKFITFLGSFYVLFVLSLGIVIFTKNNFIRFSVAYNIIAITLFNLLFKTFFSRERPAGALIKEDGYSFPSGHTMISTVFYGYLIYLIIVRVKNPKLKWSLVAILSLLIGLIGFSRIYLGVHYLSDVLGGFIFSIAYLMLGVSMAECCIGDYDEIN